MASRKTPCPPAAMKPSLRSRSLPLLLLAGLAAPAGATDEVSFSASIPVTGTGWSDSLDLPAFDPALGSLQAVRLELSATLRATGGAENPQAVPVSATLAFSGSAEVLLPSGATLAAAPARTIPALLAAFDGVIDFAGVSGFEVGPFEAGDTVTAAAPVGPAFVGPGTVSFPVSGAGQGVSSVGVAFFVTELGLELTVTYEFVPAADCDADGVPDAAEPDCDGDGTPDDCELDCDGDGTPDGCEPDSDGDGLPDDCDLEVGGASLAPYNRAGSLLIFPEYDNRAGDVSIVTVTNTEIGGGAPSVAVKFHYVDAQSCLISDRTEVLTPADTFTALTRFHNPQQAQGYLYVYCEAPQIPGNPIAYNHLIGSVLTVDGLNTLEYSAPALSLRGLPGSFDFTDVDGDGILDLDGVEYEPLADRLNFPRFLGQDGTADSELVLLALSGGAAFTSTVRVSLYNDNEEQFSVDWSFSCWTKVRLTDISPVFDNAFLRDFTDDDPAEILGAPFLESGWFQIDGIEATSTQVVLPDPAVHAILVERRAGSTACELPFFAGAQTNGDLLPLSPFGDS